MYVWLTHALETGPDSLFMQACSARRRALCPGQFCYVNGANGTSPNNEARLCYGVASPDQLREAIQRLGRATMACGCRRRCFQNN